MIRRINFKTEYIYMVFLVLLPILDQYKIFGITFEMIFGIFGLFIILLKHVVLKDKNQYKNKVLLLIGYTILVLVFQCLRLQADPVQIILRIGLYVLLTIGICFIVTDVCCFDEFKRIYGKIVLLLSLIVIAQFLIYTLRGRATMMLVPGVELNYSSFSSTDYSAETLSRLSYGWLYRPCSLFLEPAYHAQYVIPWLFLELLSIDTNDKKSIRNCLIVSIGLLLTASSLGVLGCAIAWIMAFIRWSSKLNRSAFVRNLFFLIVIIALAIVFLRIPSVQFYFRMKMDEITADNWGSNSFTMRMIRGFACFAEFGFVDKIFGCGYGNILQYITKQSISTIYDGRMGDLSYMNGAATLLCGYGALGTIYYIYVFFVRKYIKTAAYFGLICGLALIMLTSAVFNTPIYYVALTLILLMQIDSDKNTI